MQILKPCENCGNPFVGKMRRAKYCCNACYREGKRKHERERSAVKTAERAEKKAQEATKKQVWQLNAEARKLGMTYGQYQAMRYLENIRKT